MNNTFELHQNLQKKTFITDLPLCRVLLEDEANYLWLLLVPRRPHIRLLMQLEPSDQWQLMQELSLAQKNLIDYIHPYHMNVAAIGNKTDQLHIHVIARSQEDPAWPNTIWDHPTRCPYTPEQKEQCVLSLKKLFHKYTSPV